MKRTTYIQPSTSMQTVQQHYIICASGTPRTGSNIGISGGDNGADPWGAL